MKKMTIPEALAAFERALKTCAADLSTDSAHGVCWACRDTWDAFDEEALSNPMLGHHDLAEQAIELMDRALVVLEKVPEPTNEQEARRLAGFVHSITERRSELSVLAKDGINAFRQKTVLAALNQ